MVLKRAECKVTARSRLCFLVGVWEEWRASHLADFSAIVGRNCHNATTLHTFTHVSGKMRFMRAYSAQGISSRLRLKDNVRTKSEDAWTVKLRMLCHIGTPICVP